MATQRYTAALVAEVITASSGLVSIAARKLNCTPATVYNYANRYPTVAQAITDAREAMLDCAENVVFTAIERGEQWAVTFYLKTQGRSRGYGDKLEANLHMNMAVRKKQAEVPKSLQIDYDEYNRLYMEAMTADPRAFEEAMEIALSDGRTPRAHASGTWPALESGDLPEAEDDDP